MSRNCDHVAVTIVSRRGQRRERRDTPRVRKARFQELPEGSRPAHAERPDVSTRSCREAGPRRARPLAARWEAPAGPLALLILLV